MTDKVGSCLQPYLNPKLPSTSGLAVPPTAAPSVVRVGYVSHMHARLFGNCSSHFCFDCKTAPMLRWQLFSAALLNALGREIVAKRCTLKGLGEWPG